MDDVFDGYSEEAIRLATDDAVWEEALASLGTAQAVYNAVGEIVSTKTPTSLRSLVDEAGRLRYSLSGQDRSAVRSPDNGTRFGTYSLSFTKEIPEQHRPTQKLVDRADFMRWTFGKDGEEYVRQYIEQHILDFAQFVFATGEVPDGCDVVDEVIPAVPSSVKCGVLRIDRSKLARAFGAGLPNAIAALVGGE